MASKADHWCETICNLNFTFAFLLELKQCPLPLKSSSWVLQYDPFEKRQGFLVIKVFQYDPHLLQQSYFKKNPSKQKKLNGVLILMFDNNQKDRR